MRAVFKPWTRLTYQNDADQDQDTPLPPIGSTPLEGTWLPVLPQTEADAPTPDAILVEVIIVDMTSAVEQHATSALTATARGSAAPSPTATRARTNNTSDAATTKTRGSAASSPTATRARTNNTSDAATTKTKGSAAPSPIASYTSGAKGAYNVTLEFKGSWTVALQDIFVAAANRISATIVGDVMNANIGGKPIDDIVISAELKAIDGAGGTLGRAGPTALRVGSYLPATAMMQFDSADAASLHAQGLFDEIVTHEMMHAVGIGSIWAAKALLSGTGFIGKNAVTEYDKLVDAYAASNAGSTTLANGVELTKGAVPIETAGGAGTARVHWSEEVFDSEMMTGWLDTVKTGSAMVIGPISALTTASLRDLGYVVAVRPPADLFYLG